MTARISFLSLLLAALCVRLFSQNCVSIAADNIYSCPGDTLWFSYSVDTSCYPAPVTIGPGCNTFYTTDSIGKDRFADSTGYDGYSVYGNYLRGYRMQFLYTANEVQAIYGHSPKVIQAIAWQIAQYNSGSTMEGFSIAMKNVNAAGDTLQNWETGLKTVFGPKLHSPGLGWNNHNLDSLFYWDGVSDLLVEVCHYNPSTFANIVNYMLYSDEPGRGLFAKGSTDQCAITPAITRINQRPNVRLRACHVDTTLPGYLPAGEHWNTTGPDSVMRTSTGKYFAVPAVPQTYSFSVVVNGYQRGSNSLSVSFPNPPVIANTDTLYLLLGDTLSLAVTDTFNTYLWNTGNATSSIDVTADGLYTVVATLLGCGATLADSVYVELIIPGMLIVNKDTTGAADGKVILIPPTDVDSFVWEYTTDTIGGPFNQPSPPTDTLEVNCADTSSFQTTHYYRVVADNHGYADTSGWIAVNPCPVIVIDTGTVGLYALTGENIMLYPNPTRQSVTLVVSQGQGPLPFTVTDVTGRVVVQAVATETASTINLRGVPAGVYTVCVQLPQGYRRQLLIKQ